MTVNLGFSWPFQPTTELYLDFSSKVLNPNLSFSPSTILLLASPFVLNYYRHEPLYVRWGALLWAKLSVSACIVGVHAMEIPFIGHLPSLFASAYALLIGSLVFMEHRHSVRPSSLLTLFLAVDIVSRVHLFEMQFSEDTWTAATDVSLKLVLISLHRMSKKQLLVDENLRKSMDESAAGSLLGVLIWFVKSIFDGGYRARTFMQAPGELDPEVHPEVLLRELRNRWIIQQFPSPARSGDLFIACLKTWKNILLPLLVSRLSLTALRCAHPFVLRRVLVTSERQQNDMGSQSESFVAIGAALAVFLGTTLAQEHLSHLTGCFTSRLRGGLIALQLDKLQSLTESDAKNSASATLVSSDIDNIVDNIPKLLVIPVSIFELGLGSSLLSWLIDAPASIVCLPIVLSSFVCYLLSRQMVKYLSDWNSSINRRVTSTSRIIQQLTAIKMLGLGPVACEFLEKLRIAEMRVSMPLHFLFAITTIFTLIADLGVPATAIGAALSANYFEGTMVALKVFPLLSVVFSIHTSLPNLINSLPTIMSVLPCFARIQDFLSLPERRDSRITSRAQMGSDSTADYHDVICFNHADISPKNTLPAILQDVNFSLSPGSVNGVVGPHGAGKSTFLRAILGECEVLAGSVQVHETEVGYCGEDVWLKIGSIRQNIIGTLPYDPERYAAAIRASFLEEDLERLPGGDKYLVGQHGSNLSDGQRQRIGIARTAYAQHKITLLDDVFRNLDIETAICILHQLCGRNSILRQAGCTVVVVTSLPQCLEVTDQLILLDGLGHATLDRSYQTAPYHRRFTNAMRTLNTNNNTLLAVETKQQNAIYRYLEGNSTPGNPRRVRKLTVSDWKVLMFAIQFIGRFRAIMQTIFIFCLSAAEIIPDVYLLFWIEVHPEDPSLYGRYALLSLVASLVAFFTFCVALGLLSPRISIGLHKVIIDALGHSTLAFYDLVNVASLLNLVSDDALAISRGLPRAVVRISYAGFASLLMLGIIVSGNKYNAVLFPLALVVIYFLTRRYRASARAIRSLDVRKTAALCLYFNETAGGLTHLNSFHRQKQHLQDGLNILANNQVSSYHKWNYAKYLRRSTDLLGAALIAVVLAHALFVKGSCTVPSVGLVYHTAVSLPRILYEAILAFDNFDSGLEAVRRVIEFEKRTPRENGETTVDLPVDWPSRGAIEMQNASAYYNAAANALPAVSDISLNVTPGQHLGISGRSGSGKSSLFMMLLGFIRYNGVSKIDGIDVSAIAPQVLRSRLITITQEPVIFEGTVRTNLLPFSSIPNDSHSRDSVDEAKDAELELLLKRLHIWMPLLEKGGLDAIVDDVGYSKGDLKLLCIARAILRQRETGYKVILVDDATNSLNPAKETIANGVIRECFSNCTVLRSSTRSEGLEGIPDVIRLRRGRISNRRGSMGE